MNIHEAAREIIALPELPLLQDYGLCYLLREQGAEASYTEILELDHTRRYLPCYGQWTEQRLNLLCLLAVTTPEDFI